MLSCTCSQLHLQQTPTCTDPEKIRQGVLARFFSHEGGKYICTDLLQEAIGPLGSNSFSRGVCTRISKKHIATYTFYQGVWGMGVWTSSLPLWIRLWPNIVVSDREIGEKKAWHRSVWSVWSAVPVSLLYNKVRQLNLYARFELVTACANPVEGTGDLDPSW